jgi:hypothetical protein
MRSVHRFIAVIVAAIVIVGLFTWAAGYWRRRPVFCVDNRLFWFDPPSWRLAPPWTDDSRNNLSYDEELGYIVLVTAHDHNFGPTKVTSSSVVFGEGSPYETMVAVKPNTFVVIHKKERKECSLRPGVASKWNNELWDRRRESGKLGFVHELIDKCRDEGCDDVAAFLEQALREQQLR